MHRGNEGGCDDPKVSDGEPNWGDRKSVISACGHPGLADRREDDPGPGDVCWACQPCSACGERYADCGCGPADPFAAIETAEEAQARMTPEELKADRAYLEGRR